MTTIASIVKGQGDEQALPILLRRIAAQEMIGELRALRPIRVPRTRLLKNGELERYVELAARRVTDPGGVLVLLDSDGDCSIRPQLSRRAAEARSDMVTTVVLAHHEFEAWFLAAGRSLAGHHGLSPDLEDHPDPESVPSPKRRIMASKADKYRETFDQPKLAAIMNLASARCANSFDKFYREVCRFLGQAVTKTSRRALGS